MALVVVEPSLETDDRLALLFTEDEGTGVAGNGGGGEIGDVGEGNDLAVFQGVGKVARPLPRIRPMEGSAVVRLRIKLTAFSMRVERVIWNLRKNKNYKLQMTNWALSQDQFVIRNL